MSEKKQNVFDAGKGNNGLHKNELLASLLYLQCSAERLMSITLFLFKKKNLICRLKLGRMLGKKECLWLIKSLVKWVKFGKRVDITCLVYICNGFISNYLCPFLYKMYWFIINKNSVKLLTAEIYCFCVFLELFSTEQVVAWFSAAVPCRAAGGVSGSQRLLLLVNSLCEFQLG